MVTYLSYSQHSRFTKCPIWNPHDAIAVDFFSLLLSSFCPENSTLVQVFNKLGFIYTFLSITPLIMDLEHITVSRSRIPFPVLGHYNVIFEL